MNIELKGIAAAPLLLAESWLIYELVRSHGVEFTAAFREEFPVEIANAIAGLRAVGKQSNDCG